MPIRIIKKAENFSEKKLRASLKRIHAMPKATAAAVGAVKKKLHNNMTTLDIRKTVTGVLKMLDPKAMKRYLAFKKK